MRDAVFVDTSGFYALLISEDTHHMKASILMKQLAQTQRLLISTDYILDETVSLIKSRSKSKRALSLLFEMFDISHNMHFEWIGENRFFRARNYLMKHEDKDYSFTDCTSFIVMEELKLTEALASDRHFKQAGFKPLLC